jgi:hypothetical protein
MKDERQEPAEADEAERDEENVDSAELGEEDLEEASGGNYTSKNPNSPFQP